MKYTEGDLYEGMELRSKEALEFLKQQKFL